MHMLPKQMRYQAALLPDGGFPRGPIVRPQPAFGTKRNRAAQCGVDASHFPPHQIGPECCGKQHPALTDEREETRRGLR